MYPQDYTMTEKVLEQKFVAEVKKRGGLCWKFTSPGTVGVPDRIVLLKEGHFGFVEVKKPGEHLRPIQERRKEQLEKLGYKVYVLDDINMIKEILDEI